MDKIGAKIREAREQLGLTQAELGEHLEIPPETVSRYELDEQRPRAGRLRKIAEFLGLQEAVRAAAGHDETVGARVRRLRLAAGLSQAELGERIGVTFAAVSQYECGVRVPGGKKIETNAEMLLRLARALGTTTDELLGGAPVQ